MLILKDEQGSALIIALGVVVVLFVLGMAVAGSAENSILRTVWDRDSNQAFHTAEAGFNQAIYRVREGTLYPGTFTAKVSGGEYKVKVEGMTGGANEYLFNIKSIGASPNFAEAKAKRAVEARVAALNPYNMFFVSVSVGDVVVGNATINGPFYTRDYFELSGTGGPEAKFTGGPLFIKDNPSTSNYTGDLSLKGNAHVGEDANPVYLFIDGRILSGASNVHSKGTFTDVPDLNFPTVTAQDLQTTYKAKADEVITNLPVVKGIRTLTLNKAGGNYTSPQKRLTLQWNGNNGLLIVDGTVYVDGYLKIGSNIGVSTNIYFRGKGTLLVNGQVTLESNLLPETTFPDPDALGIVSPYQAQVTPRSGESIYAILYARAGLSFEKDASFYGVGLTEKMEFKNNPDLYFVDGVGQNLPPNMPVAESQVSISGWNEVPPGN